MNDAQRLSLPEGVPPGIEIWLLKLNLQAPISNSDFLLLNEYERANALRFHTHADQVRSTATRAALRRLLVTKVAMPSCKLNFLTNNFGKPYLKGASDIDFNVSHAGEYALIAISTKGKIGVDIEDCDRQLDVRALSEYVFTRIERQCAIETTEDFIKRWVAKEAVLKAVGVGISEHLQVVSVLPDNNEGYRVICDYPKWEGIKVWSIKVPNRYAAALAVHARRTLHG